VLIAEYFHGIESRILECIYVVESAIVKDQRSYHIGIIEGNIVFTDNSALHFIQFVNVKGGTELYKYSYHYQDSNGDLIFRYDMAPHHKELRTFPHHKHTERDKVIESACPTLEQVFDEIEYMIGLSK